MLVNEVTTGLSTERLSWVGITSCLCHTVALAVCHAAIGIGGHDIKQEVMPTQPSPLAGRLDDNIGSIPSKITIVHMGSYIVELALHVCMFKFAFSSTASLHNRGNTRFIDRLGPTTEFLTEE